MGVCGVAVLAIFSCGITVIELENCGIAVMSNLAMYGVYVIKRTVSGETI